MDDLVAAAGRNDRAAHPLKWVRGLVALVMSVTLAGCSTDAPTRPATSSRAEAQAYADPFVTQNGLLYPPELWQALDRSNVAALLRHQALVAAGDTTPWTAPLDATFRGAAAEVSPLAAAYLLADTLAPDDLKLAGAPWTTETAQSWWRGAEATQSVDELWQAATLVRAGGARTTPTARTLALLRAAAQGRDILPAALADDLLRDLAPSQVPTPGKPTNLRAPADAAQLLLRAALRDPQALDNPNRDLLAAAETAALTDDKARAALARAWAVSGRPDRAREAADTIDGRRLAAPGVVLEPPLFSGSVGSTFRMLRLIQARDDLATALTADARATVVAAIKRDVGTDASHRVAGNAALVLLDPGSVGTAERTDAVRAIRDSEAVASVPMPLQGAVAWTAIAEYATTLDVPMPFAGLTPQALSEWTRERPQVTAVSITRFLLALDATGQIRTASLQPTVDALSGRLASLFDTADPARMDSMLLFGGSLALRASTGQWPVPPDRLTAELDARSGGCLGGFDGFVRETVEAASHCHADTSWYAELLRQELAHA